MIPLISMGPILWIFGWTYFPSTLLKKTDFNYNQLLPILSVRVTLKWRLGPISFILERTNLFYKYFPYTSDLQISTLWRLNEMWKPTDWQQDLSYFNSGIALKQRKYLWEKCIAVYHCKQLHLSCFADRFDDDSWNLSFFMCLPTLLYT